MRVRQTVGSEMLLKVLDFDFDLDLLDFEHPVVVVVTEEGATFQTC